MSPHRRPALSRRELLAFSGAAALIGLTATSCAAPQASGRASAAPATVRPNASRDQPVNAGLSSPEPFGRTLAVSEGVEDYLIPSMVDASNGDYVLVYRAGTAHAFANGSDVGKLYVRSSSDEGVTFGPSTAIADFAAEKLDVRDPYLFREPDASRLWLTFFTGAPNLSGASWIMYSDDHGGTWSQPREIIVDTLTPGGLRRSPDGLWRMPVYRKVGGYWRASLVTAKDPLGPWSPPVDVLAPSRADASEWDFAEVSPSNWIAVVRGPIHGDAFVVQSTDRGRTWSAPMVLPTPDRAMRYDAWPALRIAADGRVLCFIRAAGGGQRLIQLFDSTKPLTPSMWGEQDGGGLLDAAPDGTCGKFQPFRRDRTWVGAYFAETAGKQAAEIRLGVFDERSLLPWSSGEVAAQAGPAGRAG